tara:strand:+ start:965 stop:1294 length:330 start_codon:yes stop_codon:yes gene_type:complete
LNNEDFEFLTKKQKSYVSKLLKVFPSGSGLRNQFLGVNPSVCKLLEQMLQFNPNKRITAEEALKNPIFDEFRNKTENLVAEHEIKTKNRYIDHIEAIEYLLNEIKLIKK